MRKLWVEREMAVPASVAWDVLTDVDRWPEWGPSVRGATLHDPPLGAGAVGTIEPFAGPRLSFEVTEFEPGARWAWKVGGVAATDHRVTPLGPHRCRVGFGVPWFAPPYLLVCREALRRIERLATEASVEIGA